MTDTRNKSVIHLTIPININLASSFLTGLVIGVVLHPLDKALYERINDKFHDMQHLFSRKYWLSPMRGLRHTIYQRIASNGIYFFLQGELNTRLYPFLKNEWKWEDKQSKFAIGLTAGSLTGFFSNGNYAVKFYTFSHRPNGRPLENALEMWRLGGYKPFTNGIYAGVSRDAIFGVIYEVTNQFLDEHIVTKIQNKLPDDNITAKDLAYVSSRFFSATLATTISSPFNHARNRQFATKPNETQPRIFDLWRDTWRESNEAIKASPTKSAFLTRVNFFARIYAIGPGTLRAGGGMAMGQLLFNKFSKSIRALDEGTKHETGSKPQNKL